MSGVSVMFPGQVTSQVGDEMVTEAVNVLSSSNNSGVSLETVAVIETPVPGCAPEST